MTTAALIYTWNPVTQKAVPIEIGGSPPDAIASSFNRPANTTAYSQNDIIANTTGTVTPLTFLVGRSNHGSGYISTATLQTNNAAWVGAQICLWLYQSLPTGIPPDNEPFLALWANKAAYIGHIVFPGLVTGGAGSDVALGFVSSTGIQFGTATDSSNIYGLLQNLTAGSLSPISGQGFHVQLRVEQN